METTYIFVKITNGLKKLFLDDILYIKANTDYCVINTKTSGRYTVHSTMKNIESIFPKDLFARIHNSYIVQIKEILTIEGDTLYVGANEPLPISRSRSNSLKDKLLII